MRSVQGRVRDRGGDPDGDPGVTVIAHPGAEVSSF